MDFAEYLIEMKSIVILAKVAEMYSILKTLLATGSWSRDEGGIELSKFFALLQPYFIKGAACHDFLLLFHKIQIINLILSSLCSTCNK